MMRESITSEQYAAFEPEQVEAICRAYTEVCVALHVFAGDRRGREEIAIRIMDLARTGVVDRRALRDRLLMEARFVA
jgi:ketosteroid isomerase-like protein